MNLNGEDTNTDTEVQIKKILNKRKIGQANGGLRGSSVRNLISTLTYEFEKQRSNDGYRAQNAPKLFDRDHHQELFTNSDISGQSQVEFVESDQEYKTDDYNHFA